MPGVFESRLFNRRSHARVAARAVLAVLAGVVLPLSVATAQSTDTTGPRAVSAETSLDGHRVTVTFDEAIRSSPTPNRGISIVADNTWVSFSRIAYVVEGRTVTVPLATPVTTGQTITANVFDPDSGERIRDLSGNVVQENDNLPVTNNVVAIRSTLLLTPDEIVENGGRSIVTATLNEASTVDTTVTVSVTPDAGAAAGDVTLSANRVLTIAAGATTSTGMVTITANDNSVQASAKTFTVSGTVPTEDGVGTPPDVQLTIDDDDSGGICGRTRQVREAILAKINGVTRCADVTATHLAGITGTLNLNSKNISFLRAGDFSGLSSLRLLELYDNALTTLPSGLLTGLSSLKLLYLDRNRLTALPQDLLTGLSLRELWARNNALTALPPGFFAGVPGFIELQLYDNPGDPSLAHLGICWTETYCTKGSPMPLEISLQALGQGRFKVVVPVGTPFDMVVSLNVTNGTIANDTITIPVGRVESDVFTVTRAAGATAAVTVDILTMRSTDPDPRWPRAGPGAGLPPSHAGFALVKAADLPVTVLPAVEAAPALASAVVDSDTLTLTYSEALDESSTPAPSAYSVSVGGVVQTPSDVTVSGSAVTLTLSSQAYGGQEVTVSYTAPASNPVQNAAGVDADNLTDHVVTNDTSNTTPTIDTAEALDVAENERTVVTLAATDPDPNATQTWNLAGGADQSHFTLSDNVLEFTAEKDFERPDDTGSDGGYEVTVTVVDDRGAEASKALTVTLTDVTESPVAPAAPTVQAVPDSTTSLKLTWTVPANTGPDITDYDYRCRKVATPAPAWVEMTDTTLTATTETMGSLTANTEYEVQVRAKNAEGASGWSPSGKGTTNAPTLTPTNLQAVGGDEQVTLTWTAPEYDGAITGYEYRFCRVVTPTDCRDQRATATGEAGWVATESVTRQTVRYWYWDVGGQTSRFRLANGARYRFQVRAVAGELVGEATAAVAATPVALEALEARTEFTPPTNLQASNLAPNKVTLSWEAPEGLTVTGYQVLIRYKDRDPAGQFAVLVESTGSTDTTYGVTGLSPNTRHVFRVKAHTADGQLTPQSRWVDVNTPAVDADATRAGAGSLGAQSPDRGRQYFRGKSLDRANGDAVDYYTFTTDGRYELGLGVRDQAIELKVVLEDENGATVGTAGPPLDPTKDQVYIEWLKTVIEPGTYYVRVEALADGATGYYIRFGLTAPPPELSVADAQAEEGTDASLDFRVTVDRAPTRTVTVAYATSDGTATAGADYTATSGTLTFATGETAKTVSVPVLDDAHDEGAETLTLTLSTASGATLADGTATGTIRNSDPLQQAWLARFGRTVGTHVTDAVGERLRGAPGQGSHLTVGGYRVPVGQQPADQRRSLDGSEPAPPSLSPGGSGQGEGGERALAAKLWGPLSPAAAAEPPGRLATVLTEVAGVLGLGAAGPGGATTDAPWLNQPGPDPRLDRSMTPTLNVDLRQILLGSSFRLNVNPSTSLRTGAADAGSSQPRLTAWGRFAGTTFDGRDGELSLDGDVFTGTVGVDSEWERLLAGVAVAHSRGEGSFTDATPDMADRGQGGLEQTLTSIHPYLRYAVTDRLDVWGLVGYGWGEMEVELANGTTLETDTNLLMGAFGGRGIVLAPEDAGGFQLATRTDAMLTRTSADAAANSAATDADAHRLRVILEGSRGVTWEDGQSFTPTVEVGLRHDWGDAETGFGLELGGRVQYADPRLGLTIEGAVRGLLAHEDADYEEWGASGTVRVDPGSTGRGLSLTLSPMWGAASSGVEGLWSRQTTAGLAPQGIRQTQTGRLQAEVGYGFAAFDVGLVTPYAGTGLAEGAARTYRVGTRLQMTGRWATGLTLNLEGTRQEPAGPQPVNQGVQVQVEWGF